MFNFSEVKQPAGVGVIAYSYVDLYVKKANGWCFSFKRGVAVIRSESSVNKTKSLRSRFHFSGFGLFCH